MVARPADEISLVKQQTYFKEPIIRGHSSLDVDLYQVA